MVIVILGVKGMMSVVFSGQTRIRTILHLISARAAIAVSTNPATAHPTAVASGGGPFACCAYARKGLSQEEITEAFRRHESQESRRGGFSLLPLHDS